MYSNVSNIIISIYGNSWLTNDCMTIVSGWENLLSYYIKCRHLYSWELALKKYVIMWIGEPSSEQGSSESPCKYLTKTNSMAYGTRRCNAAFTRALQSSQSWAESNPIPRIDTYFFKTHSNIVLPVKTYLMNIQCHISYLSSFYMH